MHLWILNHNATPPTLPGGTRHYDFAGELIRRGHRVTLFASSFHYNDLRDFVEYEEGRDHRIESFEGITVVHIKTPPYRRNDWKRVVNMLVFAKRALRLGKRAELGRPDVVLGSTVHLFAVDSARKLARHYGVPFVMEVRDLWPESLYDLGFSRWNPALLWLGRLEKKLYKAADQIITLLPKAHEYVASLGIDPEKITWISNGVDLTRRDAVPPRTRSAEEPFLVLYAGAIGQPNNMPLLIEAAEVLRDNPSIRFEIYGQGKEKELLDRMIVERGLENVSLHDPVTKREVRPLLESADALFVAVKDLPVYKYGISLNKLFDYMASARPVVFSCAAGNNPIEESGCGLTVPPGDPQAVAEAIQRLAALSPAKRESMGARGRRHVEKHYSIPVLVDRLLEVLKKSGA